MRKNFAAFCTLLVVCGLVAAGRSQPHQWEDSWREELLFASTEPFPNRVIQVDQDRYLYLQRGRRDWNRVDHGVIQLGPHGEILFLSTVQGCKAARFNGRHLSGDWGQFTLERQTEPRLKPDATWIKPHEVFSIGQIQVGMSHRKVREIYPEEYTTAHDTTQFLYGHFPLHMVDVRYDRNGLVARVSGYSLECGGRPVFNHRTRRSDVERTLPGGRWRFESEHEISQQLPWGRLSLATGRGLDEVQPGFHCVLNSSNVKPE
ncbi:MAG: hypothetical protein KIS61_29210 [Candidatus Eremiobacteraeota bacterium]|nr:hypothetical protein [Candidatus Eremiobacteraeota bacterium]